MYLNSLNVLTVCHGVNQTKNLLGRRHWKIGNRKLLNQKSNLIPKLDCGESSVLVGAIFTGCQMAAPTLPVAATYVATSTALHGAAYINDSQYRSFLHSGKLRKPKRHKYYFSTERKSWPTRDHCTMYILHM
jgi:hypothetical protein